MPRAIGQIATSAATEAPIEATTYTEPTSGAQRALKSSSASDTAAGTGARQVRVTYYTLAADGTIAGPFVETVTLNGTTAVPTVATTIALVEKMEIVGAGSGGVAAGTITMTVDNAGAGATIGTIAAGARQTLWAHHYVPSKRQCKVTDFIVSGGDAAAATFSIRKLAYPTPPGSELEVTGGVGANNAGSTPREVTLADGGLVIGPARLRAYVTPANVNAQTSLASFGYVDQVGSLV
jgi:hypothetical protein